MSTTAISSRITSTPNTLGGQSRLLSHHLTGYFTWKIAGAFCSLPPLSPERVRKIACDHSQLTSLLKSQEGWRAALTRDYLIPFLERYLPSVVENKLLQVAEQAGQSLPNPKVFIEESLQAVIAFYYDIECAARNVSKKEVITDTIDRSIEKALDEIAEINSRSEEQLISMSAYKLMNEVVSEAILDRTPWLLYWPTALTLRATSWARSVLISPLLNFASPYLPKQSVSDETLQNLSLPGRIIGCDFLRELEKKLKEEWRHPTHPHLGLDREILKEFLRKQIKVLEIGDKTSQEKLGGCFKGNSFRELGDMLQDQFILDEVCSTLEEIMAVAWKIVRDPLWRKKKTLHLYRLTNDTFANQSNLLKQDSDTKQAVKNLQISLFNHKIGGALKKAERKLDHYLTPLFNWSSLKHRISTSVRGYFGASIRDTTLNYSVPLAYKVSELATEKVVKLWSKPYSLRYGVLHRQILMRWIKA